MIQSSPRVGAFSCCVECLKAADQIFREDEVGSIGAVLGRILVKDASQFPFKFGGFECLNADLVVDFCDTGVGQLERFEWVIFPLMVPFGGTAAITNTIHQR
jgi:hypothetical protein